MELIRDGMPSLKITKASRDEVFERQKRYAAEGNVVLGERLREMRNHVLELAPRIDLATGVMAYDAKVFAAWAAAHGYVIDFDEATSSVGVTRWFDGYQLCMMVKVRVGV